MCAVDMSVSVLARGVPIEKGEPIAVREGTIRPMVVVCDTTTSCLLPEVRASRARDYVER